MHWGLVVQVRRCDIFGPDVSFCNVASGDPRSCRSNGSEHSEMAAGVAKMTVNGVLKILFSTLNRENYISILHY